MDGLISNSTTISTEWSWRGVSWSYSEVLHLISAIIGIIGNMLVMLALRKRRAAGRSTDILIGALALADFLTSIFIIPVPKASRVPQTPLGQFYCKMTLPGFLLFVSLTASAYTLTVTSVERFVAIVFPLHFNRLMARKRMLFAVVLMVWIISFLVYGVFVAIVVVVNPKTHTCFLHFETIAGKEVFGYFMFCYRFIFPCFIMLVTQIFIACKLHRRSVRFRGQEAVLFHLKARNRVLKLLLVVIIVFIATWGPGQISFFLFTISVLPPSYIGGPLHSFIIVLTSYNSCLNPIIYIFWFPEFRKSLRHLFFSKISRKLFYVSDDMKTEVSTIKHSAESNI